MKSFRDRNPYAVGIVSMGIIGLVTGLAFMVGLLHLLEHTYTMEGSFTDAAGLRIGDDVKLAGVKVGRVTGVDADRAHGRVTVTWVVNNGVDIRDEAGADIALETLLGSKYIRITNPSKGDDLYADLSRDDRLIPVDRTTTPVDVFDLTREATTRIEETDNDKLNQLIKQLATITEGKRATITDLIQSVGTLSSAINEREGQLDNLLQSADQLSANLADKDQTLVTLIDESRTILDFLVQRRDELSAALGAGSDAVRSLSVLIDTNADELDAILDDLQPTLATVDSDMSGLNRGLALAGPAFYGQSLAGTHGPWQDVYIASLGPDVLYLLEDTTP
jgi:phospholipid/cholesterol/gamma-HCH transport system substrate-binding protein